MLLSLPSELILEILYHIHPLEIVRCRIVRLFLFPELALTREAKQTFPIPDRFLYEGAIDGGADKGWETA